MFLTASEDYYQKYFIGSAIRLLRFFTFLSSLILPALYVAIITFHQEMLPTGLALRIAAQREGVPFPAMVEALMMEVFFEILREAGIRLPKIIGPAISIVGVLILGEVAVQANLVSPAMVIIVGLTAITSLTIPVFSLAIALRLLRFLIIPIAGALGLFGIAFSLIFLFIHLATLRSFGVPYLEPIAPLVLTDLKDALIRVPWWAMATRPEFTSKNRVRQGKGLTPQPPAPEDPATNPLEKEDQK
jgi:spore germination protein KA